MNRPSSDIAGNGGAGRAPLQVLDLFSGVGAYSLGLERTGGFKTVAFCEIEEYPRKILRKHWPDVRIYEDVRTLTAKRLRDDGIVPNWIVAGWPCQDISVAGTGRGLDGARSGLWGEIDRLVGEIRPVGLLLENSSNLLGINGGADFGRVLRDLAARGYDCSWQCLPAAAFDAPHIRDRLWAVCLLGDAHGDGHEGKPDWRSLVASDGASPRGEATRANGAQDAANADSDGHGTDAERRVIQGQTAAAEGATQGKNGKRLRSVPSNGDTAGDGRGAVPVTNADRFSKIWSAVARGQRHQWQPEPDVCGMVARDAAGLHRAQRIRVLGNLNPPIIPETIGRAILSARAA